MEDKIMTIFAIIFVAVVVVVDRMDVQTERA